jgi:hypothetical protein
MNPKIRPFLWASFIWGVILLGLCWGLTPDSVQMGRSIRWGMLFYGLCLVNLVALVKTLNHVFQLMGGKAGHSVQALIWGSFKLVCLGLFIIVLLKGQQNIPSVGLIAGLSTWVAVPLIGGFLWSQRILQHA